MAAVQRQTRNWHGSRNRNFDDSKFIKLDTQSQEKTMLGWALTFFILAIIAGLFGFTGIAGASAGIAQILFILFFVLLVISLLARAIRGRPPL